MTILKRLKKKKTHPGNLIHLYLEIKSILMVNILLVMGERYPQIHTQGPTIPISIQGA